MTIKRWYPEYNILKRILVWLKYKCDAYSKSMSLDCYLYYKFDKLSKFQKKNILLDYEVLEFEKKFNDDKYREIFNNKKLFYQHFNKYMKRKIIFLDETTFDEYKEFLNAHKTIALKPPCLYGGKGFRIVSLGDYTGSDREDILLKEYNLLKNSGYIAEEYIVNHEAYKCIYDKCLNTIRVNTLVCKDGSVNVYAVINQFGSGGSITDNDEDKGIWAAVNLNTGIICEVEKDDETAEYYSVHPDTKKEILGFKNIMFDEVIRLAKELALVCKDVRLVGWDIAVTDKGIELVEGNVTPELGVYQAMTGEGLRLLFESEIM